MQTKVLHQDVMEVVKNLPNKSKDPNHLVILLAGDVAYPRNWFEREVSVRNESMYRYVRRYLKRANILFVNLESPFTNAPFTVEKAYPMASPPERLKWILDAGFNLFSLSNNHMGDAGIQGIKDTLDLLQNNKAKGKKIWWAGVSETKHNAHPTVFQVPRKKIKIAFFAFGWHSCDLITRLYKNSSYYEIKKAKEEVDIVIVSAHFGKEYLHLPEEWKISIFRELVNFGADIVVGHHPHVIQPVEVYKRGVIFYSLGNFSFASRTTLHHKTGAKLYGMLPFVEIRNKRIIEITILPMYVNNLEPFIVEDEILESIPFTPRVVEGKFAEKIIYDLLEWNKQIHGNKTKYQIKDNQIKIQVQT